MDERPADPVSGGDTPHAKTDTVQPLPFKGIPKDWLIERRP